jgi:CelD/BcsL family acetyltransferase involved in cellulose biosynthesis
MSNAVVEKLRAEANRGWLRIYVLRLGGRPSAFWMGALYQGVFYAEFTGYNPIYARHSPGLYVLSRMMEELCASNVTAFDFASGSEEYKKRFGNRERQVAPLHVFAPSFKGLRFAAMKLFATAVRELLRWLLERLRLTRRVKKGIRQTSCVKGNATYVGTSGVPRGTL